MMIKFFRIKILFFSIFVANLQSMIDNRFLPLYRQMYNRQSCKRSDAGFNIFFLFAGHSIGCDGKDIGLFELDGKYDLIKVAKSLELIGKENPLGTQTQVAHKLEFDINGKLDGQGTWLGCEYNFFNNFSLGISIFLLHLASRQNLVMTEETRNEFKIKGGNEIILDQALRKTNDLLGIKNFQYSKAAPSDIDLYLRYGKTADYVYKFRKIDGGLNLGFLFPSGPTIETDNPASIPFGGNGHFGIYGMIDLALELKEDLIVGFWIELLKRLPKTQTRRISLNDVPDEFGALIRPVRINPGITVGFSPFVSIEDIRDGFGFKIRYTMVHHEEDEWIFLERNKLIKKSLNNSVSMSEWANEYFTFTLMYDFAKGSTRPRKFAPIVYFEWEMPVKFIFANQVARTNLVSFGFEFNF